eukprot:3519149-Prorocentrum_lima.AAC.1
MDTKGRTSEAWTYPLARNLFERPDDSAPTSQQWMIVEDPDGQNIWIRKDGASRSSRWRKES